MDFIEQLFGIAPDGGDGSLELLYVAAIVVAMAAVACRRPIMRWIALTRRRHH